MVDASLLLRASSESIVRAIHRSPRAPSTAETCGCRIAFQRRADEEICHLGGSSSASQRPGATASIRQRDETAFQAEQIDDREVLARLVA